MALLSLGAAVWLSYTRLSQLYRFVYRALHAWLSLRAPPTTTKTEVRPRQIGDCFLKRQIQTEIKTDVNEIFLRKLSWGFSLCCFAIAIGHTLCLQVKPWLGVLQQRARPTRHYILLVHCTAARTLLSFYSLHSLRMRVGQSQTIKIRYHYLTIR